ncbi:MAG: ABC transporter ATP-binding protein, partial [Acidobacteriaceae bacterium]|nr:ABC transporter ATP-binding protein [Acidobacteriaceae bacterium]
MSPRSAILVESLGKCFRLDRGDPTHGLHRRLEQVLRSALVRQRSGREGNHLFWALRDVSFEVKSGEIFGIVGGNGAGKSVLLKILSRVTRPTEGQAFVRGRPGALLQLGTVVHPELTGRQNIHQSAAILRLEKNYIRRKFDEIVAFSELEAFLDVPVRKYSTGMQARLAFALVSQLDTEILFIDETLAVGDERFREKSLARMDRLVSDGRTIVVVSHDLAFIRNRC